MQKGNRMEPPVETNNAGQPLIHKILERLGVLDAEDTSSGMVFTTPWGNPYQPAVNGAFRSLPESPPITPSIQGASFTGFGQFPGVRLESEHPLQNSQVPAKTPRMSDIIPFGQTGQTTSGLMLSISSPPSSYSALCGEDSTNFNLPFGPMQWPGYNTQEDFYEFPQAAEIS